MEPNFHECLFCGFSLCRGNDIQDVLQKVLDASRAPSTVSKYKRAFAFWSDWCRRNFINPISANKHDMARYFISMYNNGKPFSTIEAAFYAIKWHLDTSFSVIDNPCDSKFLKLLIEGLKRLLKNPTKQKEPITAGMLHEIVTKFGSTNNLMHIRMCALLLVSFAGFFRNDELINMKLNDVKLFPSHATLFVSRSKTDQYREGAWVVLAKTEKPTCPVGMLEKYLRLADMEDLSVDDYLFKPLLYKKSTQKYAVKKGKLSYGRCREILHEALKGIGVDPKGFGLHSLRSGGASAAAAVGVQDRLIKKHGRWQTDSSKDRYV